MNFGIAFEWCQSSIIDAKGSSGNGLPPRDAVMLQSWHRGSGAEDLGEPGLTLWCNRDGSFFDGVEWLTECE